MKVFVAMLTVLPLCASLLSIFRISSAADTMVVADSLSPHQTLVSAGEVFELGFFSPGKSLKQYVGIWYKVSNTTVVWVANREAPVLNTPGVLRFLDNGTLEILDTNKTLIWSSQVARAPRTTPSAQLLDSGNFVVTDGNSSNEEDILWQGFDYPVDTHLPWMKIGRDLARNRDVYLSVWKSEDDPAEGEITFKLDIHGVPQSFLRKNTTETFRSGPWNGIRFSGRPNLKPNSIYKYGYYTDKDWIYYEYEPYIRSVLMRTIISSSGASDRLIWSEGTKSWNSLVTFKTDNCDTYAYCGADAVCNINNAPVCGCLKGFQPKSKSDWDMAGWSGGCIRKTSLNCTDRDGFVTLSGVKVPDTRNATSNSTMTLEECRISCLRNCSCTAYANSDIRNGGSGCWMWFGQLIDIREYTENGQDIYVKLAHSDLDQAGSSISKSARIILNSVLSAGVVILCLILALYILKKRRQRLTKQGLALTTMRTFRAMKGENSERGYSSHNHKDDLELPLFDFDTLSKATGFFSHQNKLGEGGFGPVYKGILEGGQEIAVKRLSNESKQGTDEFANEVLCIVKLQHRNLVKLLGCCIREEKILVYEYMGNKSLDFFIFDEKRSMLLDWPKRFNIINGISRGLLYLHQDSRLRIIHRDLKASNILLDYEMNPRISDFGMARCFGGNETSANTTRVVGTYGYMSPEYAVDGLFSVKSDVFSFGVLVLEIIAGKRNRGFYHPDHHLNLLGHAWKLYGKGRFSELIDDSICDSCNMAEFLRSIHVALLCVQQNPEDRPTMSQVVLMLSSEGALLEPKQPGFFTPRNPVEADSSTSKVESISTNEMHGDYLGRGSFPELIDESISDSTKFEEILRSVHVGLLYVEQRPDDRPSMANVVMMLSSGGELPEPKQPGFFTPRTPPPMEAAGGSGLSKVIDEAVLTNGMSITIHNALAKVGNLDCKKHHSLKSQHT